MVKAFRDESNVEIRFVDGEEISLQREGTGRLKLYLSDGQRYDGVRPLYLMPLTDPCSFVRLLDREGNEICILRDIEGLRPEDRRPLEEVLKRNYLIPTITKIKALTEEYGITHWEVETDRGPRRFEVRNRSTDIQIISPRTVLIRDADQNRYKIPDYNELSYYSRMLLYGEI